LSKTKIVLFFYLSDKLKFVFGKKNGGKMERWKSGQTKKYIVETA
jgi:hypothetical protein